MSQAPRLLDRPIDRRRSSAETDQRGSTLVEALIAVMIVSILLLGVMAALSTSATVSRSTGQATRTRAALAAVSDRVATLPYPGCVTAAELTNTVRTAVMVPVGYTATVTRIESLLPAAAMCSAQSTVLKVTIVVAHPASGRSMKGEVVVRDRSARPG